MSVFATINLSKSGYPGVPRELDPHGKGFMYGENIARMGIEGNRIPGSYETFDDVAIAAGATPISAFLDYSEMDNPGREIDGLPLLVPKWFSIEDGLKTVEALLDGLSSRGIEEGLLWDLRASQLILKSAIGSGESFHFSVV